MNSLKINSIYEDEVSERQKLEELFHFLIGMKFWEARLLMKHKYELRILKRDGVDLVVDSKYVDYRINVEVEDKKITALLSVG